MQTETHTETRISTENTPVPSATLLYYLAEYEGKLRSDDQHMQYFWLAVYELCLNQQKLLLLALFPHIFGNRGGGDGGGVGHDFYFNRNFVIRFTTPTALALLNADTAEIAIFPPLKVTDAQSNTLYSYVPVSVPRFSSANMAQIKVRNLLSLFQLTY